MARQIQETGSRRITAPTELPIMTFSCCRAQTSNCSGFSQSLQLWSGFSGSTSRAVLYSMKSSKLAMEPKPEKARGLIFIAASVASLQNTSKANSSWMYIHHWQSCS